MEEKNDPGASELPKTEVSPALETPETIAVSTEPVVLSGHDVETVTLPYVEDPDHPVETVTLPADDQVVVTSPLSLVDAAPGDVVVPTKDDGLPPVVAEPTDAEIDHFLNEQERQTVARVDEEDFRHFCENAKEFPNLQRELVDFILKGHPKALRYAERLEWRAKHSVSLGGWQHVAPGAVVPRKLTQEELLSLLRQDALEPVFS